MRKRAGKTGVYQSGCKVSGIRRNTEPRADWCSVEMIIPAIMSGISILLTIFNGILHLIRLTTGKFNPSSRSNTAGLNSKARTIV